MKFLSTLGMFLICSSAYANAFEINWGTNHKPVDYYTKAAQKFKKNVESRSKNQIKVNLIFKVNEFDNEHIRKFEAGEFQMSQAFTSQITEKVPEFSLFSLPFLFTNDDHVTKWINSASSKKFLAKLEKHGVHALGFTYSGGFTQVLGDEMKSFDDYRGKDIVIDDADANYNDFVRETFATKLIDNNSKEEIIPFTANKDIKYFEVIAPAIKLLKPQGYGRNLVLNLTGQRLTSRVLFISQKFLDSLPVELQKIVIDEGEKAAIYERTMAIKDQNNILAQYKKYKVTLNKWSNETKLAEKTKFKKLYENYKAQYGSETIDAIEALR